MAIEPLMEDAATFPLPGPPDRAETLRIAQKIFNTRFADFDCALAAGSILRGEAGPGSDLDLILLSAAPLPQIWRESFICDGLAVDLFVHDVRAQDAFFAEDQEEGVPSTLRMVIEAVPLPAETALARQQKAKAAKLYEAGPPPLTEDQINSARYFITDLWEDLRDPKTPLERLMIEAELRRRLADLSLRAAGFWSGQGKGLARALHRHLPDLAETLATPTNLHQSVPTLLTPWGGPLWAGYKAVKE